MPFYRIVEQRMYEETYIVEAEDKETAKYAPNIVHEEEITDSWQHDIKSVEEVLVEDWNGA